LPQAGIFGEQLKTYSLEIHDFKADPGLKSVLTKRLAVAGLR
jgi:hypothetical protein